MSDLAIQHSMSPRFSICSFPAPLQQQEVSPFPSPAMCCRVPKRAQISSPNLAMGTFLLPPPPWECPDVSSPSQLLTAFWTESQSKPSSPHHTPNLLLGWSPPPTLCGAGGHEGLFVWSGCSQNSCKHQFYCLFPT